MPIGEVATPVLAVDSECFDIMRVSIPSVKRYLKHLDAGSKVGLVLAINVHRTDDVKDILPGVTFTNICVDLTLEADNTEQGSHVVYARVSAVGGKVNLIVHTYNEECIKNINNDGIFNPSTLATLTMSVVLEIPGYEIDTNVMVLPDPVSISSLIMLRAICSGTKHSRILEEKCNTLSERHMLSLFNTDVGSVARQCANRTLGI